MKIDNTTFITMWACKGNKKKGVVDIGIYRKINEGGNEYTSCQITFKKNSADEIFGTRIVPTFHNNKLYFMPCINGYAIHVQDKTKRSKRVQFNLRKPFDDLFKDFAGKDMDLIYDDHLDMWCVEMKEGQ